MFGPCTLGPFFATCTETATTTQPPQMTASVSSEQSGFRTGVWTPIIAQLEKLGFNASHLPLGFAVKMTAMMKRMVMSADGSKEEDDVGKDGVYDLDIGCCLLVPLTA